jgi:hypothetical protein
VLSIVAWWWCESAPAGNAKRKRLFKVQATMTSVVSKAVAEQLTVASRVAHYWQIRQRTEEVVHQAKQNLMRVVQKEANRPHIQFRVESTVAMEGLRRDYLSMCSDSMGGLLIVYDKKGMGKSHALQGVARAKSAQTTASIPCY